MFTVNTAAWVAIALLAPFWWGLGLLILAWLGDVSPRWRPRISRLFDRLQRPLEALASSEQAEAS